MKSKEWIQAALSRAVAKVTAKEQLLPRLLRKAAKRRNISLLDQDLEKLTNAILSAEGNVATVDMGAPCSFGETEEEVHATVQGLINELNGSIGTDIEEDLSEKMSAVISEALRAIAGIISEHIADNALEHTLDLRRAHALRAELVQRLWGKALERLDFQRHIVLEWSGAAIELRKGPYASPNTAFALKRLVDRAYEVVGEIIILVSGGYADGALARWRSLHEICVTAIFLAKQSDRCALMYLSHHRVEELRLREADRASRTGMIRNRNADRSMRELRLEVSAMIDRFGAAFVGDYGWASIELGRSKTTFRDLEHHVGLEALRRRYKWANSTVHGGALATLKRITLRDTSIDGVHVAPALGCEVATECAAGSLSMMIAELCLESDSADLLAMSMVVHDYAHRVREQISQKIKEMSGDTPRARILQRKAQQGKNRVKKLRIPRRR
ncbi:DUF5677 domain-containing protein [Massilia agilis]|uniref:DUF5677 domain-containing protein n=1 Tax=Massilia agilis TaxID=1811226 RepID=A0ABT2DFK7_9BURK|nr:DUF5677 domain-containing protein [Massilia agilis]MCS0809193.1 DUF5677 domain-containing protein [Massilia agilis]